MSKVTSEEAVQIMAKFRGAYPEVAKYLDVVSHTSRHAGIRPLDPLTRWRDANPPRYDVVILTTCGWRFSVRCDGTEVQSAVIKVEEALRARWFGVYSLTVNQVPTEVSCGVPKDQ